MTTVVETHAPSSPPAGQAVTTRYRGGGVTIVHHAARAPLAPQPLAAEQVLAGHPQPQVAELRAAEGSTLSCGIWECGPGLFRWHYGGDEVIQILEGAALYRLADGIHRVEAGDVVHFCAGSTVIWEIPEHVKKLWVLSEPERSLGARLRKWVTRAFRGLRARRGP